MTSLLNVELMGAFRKGLDALIFLMAASRELNNRRRELIKPGINKDYAHLCSSNIATTEFLFGDDLPQQVKELTELNRVANQLQASRGRSRARGRGFRGRGRGAFMQRGGHSFHPYHGQRRGRGHGPHRGGRGAPRGRQEVNTGKTAEKLALFADKWRSLTNDPFLLDTVLHSHLDFENDILPRQLWEPKPIKFNKVESRVIDEEIEKQLDKGVITECSDVVGQFVSNIFTREKKDGSFRVILNLSQLNRSVEYHKFKMETLNSIVKLM